MTRYSVQPTDQMFVKDHGFLSLAKNMGKNIGKNISKNLSGKYSQKLLYHAKQSATDEKFKKQQEQLVIWLVIILLIKLCGFQKIRRKLQIRKIKKHLKKDVYFQKKIQEVLDDLRLK